MVVIRIISLYFVFLSLIANSQEINLSKFEYFTNDQISSASGIESINGTTYIISDDQASLFITDNFSEIKKIKIIDSDKIRIDKLYKPDFEALGKINIKNSNHLLIISSGSKIDYRDTVFLFSVDDKKIIAKRNFRNIYNKMKISANLNTNYSINIEAVSVDSNSVYLFQRGNLDGNNVIFKFSKKEFLEYLNGKQNNLEFEFKKFTLPILNSKNSGFSGACYLNENEMIFTASVEINPDTYQDGAILGSYIGILNYETGGIKYTLFEKNNKVVITKLESVYIINKISENSFRIFLSSDNDNGVSEFYKVVLKINNGSN